MENLIEYFKARTVKVEMEEELKKIQPDIPEDEDEEEDGDFNADEVDSDDDDD